MHLLAFDVVRFQDAHKPSVSITSKTLYIFVHSLLINTVDCESFDVVRFNLGPLLQGQMIAKVKGAYNSLIIGPRGTYRKSWAANLLMWSDLTLGPCFKVK